MGVSEQTFYRWKKKYGGLSPSEVRKLRQLEEENARLRRVSAKLRDDRTDTTKPNQCWSMDFMAAELFDGRRLRLLTIVDNFSRVSPFIGTGFSYKGYDVVSSRK